MDMFLTVHGNKRNYRGTETASDWFKVLKDSQCNLLDLNMTFC